MNNKKNILIVLLCILTVVFFISSEYTYYKLKENTELNSALNDTIKIWKDKDGLNHAKISVLQTKSSQDFIDLQSKDKTIQELQAIVKENKKRLGKKGSVTIIKGDTKYDTVYKTKDSIRIVLGDKTISDSIHNDWITSTFGFTSDSTFFTLQVRNDYSIIIGEDPQGLFKKKKPFAEVVSHNPYSEIDTLRTYQVEDNRPKFNLKSAAYGGAVATIIFLILNSVK